MSKHDAVFEPLLGKRRSVRRALLEVAERWARSPIEDGGVRAALAREFVAGLAAGEGTAAVERVFPGPR